MKIRFNLWGMECKAIGEVVEGEFKPESIMVSGLLDMSQLTTTQPMDELQRAMDKAVNG